MNDLAVVLITCDKYSWLWDAWYYHFRKNWGIDCPVYFCNEVKPVQYEGVTQNACGYVSPNANQWTKQVRECVDHISEQHLFLVLEDLLFDQSITSIFQELYVVFKQLDADALRIRSKSTKADLIDISEGIEGLKRLSDSSRYLITFSANLWHKRFLMQCLSNTQSPWAAERSNRMRYKGYRVFDYHLPNWYVNALVGGVLTTDGEKKIKEWERDYQ